VLLLEGARPNRSIDNGVNALVAASAKGHEECVRYLLDEARAVPRCATDTGNTPLHFACMGGHVAVAGRLLRADPGVYSTSACVCLAKAVA
jgi:ankyrin repeat protein